MINIDTVDINDLIDKSPDYKLIQKNGSIYIIDSTTCGNSDIGNAFHQDLREVAALVVNNEGRVVKSRYGVLPLADDPAIQAMQYH